jgi:hypothetical protein
MREYIEEWLMKALVNIIEKDHQEEVTTVIPPLAQQQPYTKDASTRK